MGGTFTTPSPQNRVIKCVVIILKHTPYKILSFAFSELRLSYLKNFMGIFIQILTLFNSNESWNVFIFVSHKKPLKHEVY